MVVDPSDDLRHFRLKRPSSSYSYEMSVPLVHLRYLHRHTERNGTTFTRQNPTFHADAPFFSSVDRIILTKRTNPHHSKRKTSRSPTQKSDRSFPTPTPFRTPPYFSGKNLSPLLHPPSAARGTNAGLSGGYAGGLGPQVRISGKVLCRSVPFVRLARVEIPRSTWKKKDVVLGSLWISRGAC